MTGAGRRWLTAVVALLALVAGVIAWDAIQTERRSSDAQPVVTGETATPRPVSGDALAPSNRLGAPVPAVPVDPGVQDDDSPIAPWWQRVPPVEGDLVPINRLATGHVRIDRGDGGLQITFEHLRVATPDEEVRNLRVVLSAGVVVGERRGYWSERGEPYTLSDLPIGDLPDGGLVSITFQPTTDMPPDVRSVILFDADTGELLGGAALFPVD
ncbi:hypothetical protein [Curtobacterium sp. L1-20]|uniref:hypothetical protein n=1 Tax=Curtobacterium sp. L1-20 TaxID=3138181 RepID=UPI003B52F799